MNHSNMAFQHFVSTWRSFAFYATLLATVSFVPYASSFVTKSKLLFAHPNYSGRRLGPDQHLHLEKRLEPVSLEEIKDAQKRLAGHVVRTPLVRLNVPQAPAEIYLKLENLQPFGSFKVRGAGNFILGSNSKELEAAGVWTASAGNMAQAVASFAAQQNLPCTVVVPDTAPVAKLSALERMSVSIRKVPIRRWLEIYQTHHYPGVEGLFVHAFADKAVMAGNGSIGLEMMEDLPDFDTVLVPYGGGGLACGVAAAIKAIRPEVKVYACEVQGANPLAASWEVGKPVEIDDYQPSFVDGCGSPMVFEDMWPLAQELLDGSLIVDVDTVASSIQSLARYNKVMAEGAGAVPVAAALSGQAGTGKVVCVVSGGNIDLEKLVTIFQGQTP